MSPMKIITEADIAIQLQFLIYSQSAGHAFEATHPFCYWKGTGQPCRSQQNLHVSRLAQL